MRRSIWLMLTFCLCVTLPLAAQKTTGTITGVVTDPAGNLYIADSENNAIRKVNSSTQTIATLAGNGTALFSGDGFDANLAGLYKPYSLYLDSVFSRHVSISGSDFVTKIVCSKCAEGE